MHYVRTRLSLRRSISKNPSPGREYYCGALQHDIGKVYGVITRLQDSEAGRAAYRGAPLELIMPQTAHSSLLALRVEMEDSSIE